MSGNGKCIVIGDNRDNECHKGINGGLVDFGKSCRGAGAVFVYKKDSTGVWTRKSYLKTIGSIDEDESFGRRIAVDDDCQTIAVGELNNDSAFTGVNNRDSFGEAIDSGAVYVF